MTTIETLRADVQRIRAAQNDVLALGKLYKEIVGYSPMEDDPWITMGEVYCTLLDFIREECHALGIHVSLVGLTEES